jgi:hypothetical protein
MQAKTVGKAKGGGPGRGKTGVAGKPVFSHRPTLARTISSAVELDRRLVLVQPVDRLAEQRCRPISNPPLAVVTGAGGQRQPAVRRSFRRPGPDAHVHVETFKR